MSYSPFAQSDQHGPLDRRVRNVLDFDPVAAAPRAITTISPLGDNALKPHVARGAEHKRAINILDMLALLAFKIYPDSERAARADPDHL